MTHCREETFGPVASITRVKDNGTMEEAITHTSV
jgi:acyl-CoA reductase-like NAD-dependent aldehyde dehydrogenase